MKTQSLDTPPEIEKILVERYRRTSPQEKIRAIKDLNRTVLLMALAGMRHARVWSEAAAGRLAEVCRECRACESA